MYVKSNIQITASFANKCAQWCIYLPGFSTEME